jgi:hypothetical protein
MSYAVATWPDTSSKQATKDPGQRRCGHSTLGKIVIKSVAVKRVATTFVAAQDFAGKSASRYPPSRAKSGLCEVPLSADAFRTVPSPNPHLQHLAALQLCRSRHLNNSGQLVLESVCIVQGF